jgi:outer membrane lipoprotein carrier protein
VGFVSLVAVALIPDGYPPAAERLLDSADLMAGLQGWLDRTQRLQGRFDQELISGALGGGIEEKGRVYVQRPGRMRWDYLEPERKVALVDGNLTWLYQEEDEQLILGRLEDQGEILPRLLAGEERIADAFEASVLSAPRRPGGGAYRLRLIPAGGEESFEELVLAIRPPRFAIESVELLDAAGNRILYRFHDLRRNEKLPPGIFAFEPPPGTLIIGEH